MENKLAMYWFFLNRLHQIPPSQENKKHEFPYFKLSRRMAVQFLLWTNWIIESWTPNII
jgi:hypothetical protein